MLFKSYTLAVFKWHSLLAVDCTEMMVEDPERGAFGKWEWLRSKYYQTFPKMCVFAFITRTWRHLFIVIKIKCLWILSASFSFFFFFFQCINVLWLPVAPQPVSAGSCLSGFWVTWPGRREEAGVIDAGQKTIAFPSFCPCSFPQSFPNKVVLGSLVCWAVWWEGEGTYFPHTRHWWTPHHSGKSHSQISTDAAFLLSLFGLFSLELPRSVVARCCSRKAD